MQLINFFNFSASSIFMILTLGKAFKVSMATNQFTAHNLGQIITDIKVPRRTYFNISFCVVAVLYADVILGLNFQKQHKKVVFQLSGHQKKMIM